MNSEQQQGRQEGKEPRLLRADQLIILEAKEVMRSRTRDHEL